MPRQSMTWDEFVSIAPKHSIALDGVVLGGPRFDPKTGHANFDHHDNVVREATMSTAMQAYFAIKGGIMKLFLADKSSPCTLLINDTDQDTALAVWLLVNYEKFEGTQSIPHINRLIALTDRWDITGGGFPMDLDEQVIKQHAWIFKPYTDLRKSGKLAVATKEVLRRNLDNVMARLDKYLVGQAGKLTLDTRHQILYESPAYKIVHEIGGNDARYHLFSRGMDAFVSLVATRPDGRFVYSIGRRSQYIPFPVEELYDDLNTAEGFNRSNGWNGSNIVGGSSRMNGSSLSWETVRDIVNRRLKVV